MPAPSSRRAVAAGLVGVLLLALTGCARGGGAADGVSVLARGAERTLGAHTFRFETTMESDGGPMVISGAFDTDRKVGGIAFGRGGAWPPDQILGRDGKMYQRREMLPRSMQVPTAWVVVDLEAVQRSIATQPQPDGVALNSGERPDREDFNPATLLDELRQKAARVDRDGADVVRGVSTT